MSARYFPALRITSGWRSLSCFSLETSRKCLARITESHSFTLSSSFRSISLLEQQFPGGAHRRRSAPPQGEFSPGVRRASFSSGGFLRRPLPLLRPVLRREGQELLSRLLHFLRGAEKAKEDLPLTGGIVKEAFPFVPAGGEGPVPFLVFRTGDGEELPCFFPVDFQLSPVSGKGDGKGRQVPFESGDLPLSLPGLPQRGGKNTDGRRVGLFR